MESRPNYGMHSKKKKKKNVGQTQTFEDEFLRGGGNAGGLTDSFW